MKIHGRCHCGAMSFNADIDTARVMACHCTDCQVFSGGPFRAVAVCAHDDLRLSGTPKLYVKVAESGNRRAQAFCGDCGTHLYATSADGPGNYSIRLGCVDERAQLAPKSQVWAQSAMPWLHDLPNAPAVPKQVQAAQPAAPAQPLR